MRFVREAEPYNATASVKDAVRPEAEPYNATAGVKNAVRPEAEPYRVVQPQLPFHKGAKCRARSPDRAADFALAALVPAKCRPRLCGTAGRPCPTTQPQA